MATPIDVYIGQHATDAAAATYISNHGWTVQEGWLYYDTTLDVLKIYNGHAWTSLWETAVGPTSFKSYSFNTHSVGAGSYYAAGYYEAPAADANLDQASASQTLGTANNMYAAHVFIVAGGAGVTDAGTIAIRVTGTSITDAGVRTGADTEDIVADFTTLAQDDYAESAKKFIGQVTISLVDTAGGATAYSIDVNYGWAKYEDFGNRDFKVTDFEVVGVSGAADTSFDVELLLHSDAGWTYSAAAFVPGGTVIASSKTISAPEDETTNNEYFAFKRAGLTQDVSGSDSEGIVVRVTVGAANTVDAMDIHVGVEHQ
jgi:hypothetical protein